MLKLEIKFFRKFAIANGAGTVPDPIQQPKLSVELEVCTIGSHALLSYWNMISSKSLLFLHLEVAKFSNKRTYINHVKV